MGSIVAETNEPVSFALSVSGHISRFSNQSLYYPSNCCHVCLGFCKMFDPMTVIHVLSVRRIADVEDALVSTRSVVHLLEGLIRIYSHSCSCSLKMYCIASMIGRFGWN